MTMSNQNKQAAFKVKSHCSLCFSIFLQSTNDPTQADLMQSLSFPQPFLTDTKIPSRHLNTYSAAHVLNYLFYESQSQSSFLILPLAVTSTLAFNLCDSEYVTSMFLFYIKVFLKRPYSHTFPNTSFIMVSITWSTISFHSKSQKLLHILLLLTYMESIILI